MSGAAILTKLRMLRDRFEIKLEGNPLEERWTLTIGRELDREGGKEFIYEGELDAIIERAWSGSPPDRIGKDL